MITDFDAGVLLPSAVTSSGTSTFASGKYAAAQPRGVGWATALDRRAKRSPSVHRLIKSTTA